MWPLRIADEKTEGKSSLWKRIFGSKEEEKAFEDDLRDSGDPREDLLSSEFVLATIENSDDKDLAQNRAKEMIQRLNLSIHTKK